MTNNAVWSLESRKIRSHRDMTFFFSPMSKKEDVKTSLKSEEDNFFLQCVRPIFVTKYQMFSAKYREERNDKQ
jgi:hypothetical protein